MLGCFIFRPDHNTRVMQVIFLLSQIYEGLIVPHGKVHHVSKLPDACLQFGHHFNPIGDSDDEDEDDEHLDHDAITLPGAGLQLGDHLDQVGVLLEESPQPERDVRRVHLEFEHVGDGDDDTDDDVVFVPTSPSVVTVIPTLVNASERPGKH